MVGLSLGALSDLLGFQSVLEVRRVHHSRVDWLLVQPRGQEHLVLSRQSHFTLTPSIRLLSGGFFQDASSPVFVVAVEGVLDVVICGYLLAGISFILPLDMPLVLNISSRDMPLIFMLNRTVGWGL